VIVTKAEVIDPESKGCVFLDRDGVINRKAPAGDYIKSWDEFHFIPGIVDWIRIFNALSLLVIVVTNQRGVSRGLMTARDVDTIHARMTEELKTRGARVDDVFCCMHEEDVCDCRKPKPGLILQARRKWNIDLSRSILIGDTERDRQLAEACRLPFLLVGNGNIQATILPQPVA
jgi:D-glycero-D-manno-heptose 1,7-bisphosphate phosphatase